MADEAIINAMVEALAKAAAAQKVINQENLPYFVSKMKEAFLSVNGGTVKGGVTAETLTANQSLTINGWTFTVESGS